ncbi:unnamed protein product [Caenorhabditis angaria]|uniref:Uncharacterized protein n=1 Tax=Caenorhabditis angaria TaxID=860376 RepID=A0A9P1N9E1_9PELO|nr:unnamed protein product [Caenorhabditis angaria]
MNPLHRSSYRGPTNRSCRITFSQSNQRARLKPNNKKCVTLNLHVQNFVTPGAPGQPESISTSITTEREFGLWNF